MRFAKRIFSFAIVGVLAANLAHWQPVQAALGAGDDLPIPPATPAEKRLQAYKQRMALQDQSLVANVRYRSIGPTVMSGRVADLDVSPTDPTHFYVAYASGGLWKTENNGLSFTPIFDEQAVMTIGDIAVDWQHGETIWVGTGENNSSRSSYSGTGIYKSTDGGKTWQHMGLGETHHIGRIIIHPDDPNTVWVAALGHLYSYNPDRGVYKTTDGGKTWRKTLFVDDTTGAIDLVIDPGNPDVLYAATWHRERFAWNFVESGVGSGIYKSTDGGETWTRLNTPESGFPTGPGVGRIGLAIYPGNPQILYAIVDNQNRRPKEKKEDEPDLTKDQLRTMSREAFLKLDDAVITEYLDYYNFPLKYTAKSIKERVRKGEITPKALVDFLEDANRQLFDTPVIGPEVYRSEDGGKTWKKTHDDYIDALFYSYGYYFGQIRVAPDDADRIYIAGVPILKSEDGGKTFTSINEANVHVDHHALWISDRRKGHLIIGNDGGINISWDDGKTWFKANTIAVGQFYAIAVDMAKPYNVYGGLQDNGVWYGPSTYKHSLRWTATGNYPWKMLMGGDGMQVEVDTRDNNTVYTGFQFGNYFRISKKSGRRKRITPQHELGQRPYRWNWQTPIKLSPHHQDILYMGSNYLHRSMDKGETWQTISGDLTRGGKKGDVPYGTLTTIDESPLRFGLIYVGSDDGLVHMTPDGGNTWKRISDSLPQNLWVSRVEVSQHDTATVYVALNGYRWDDFTAYLYKSTDYGQTWQRIGTDLPDEPINVVVEDPENKDLLYVGTDHGVYISLDGGRSFMAMMNNLPHAPVHDLVVHPREKDLVVGTHGRSIYIANVEHVQQLTPEMRRKPLHLFPLDKVTFSENWGRKRANWAEANEPKIEIAFYAGQSGRARIQIITQDGILLKRLWDDTERGLNYVSYDLTVDSAKVAAYNKALKRRFEKKAKEKKKRWKDLKPADNGQVYLRPGKYTVEVTLGKTTVRQTLEIKERKRPKRGVKGKR